VDEEEPKGDVQNAHSEKEHARGGQAEAGGRAERSSRRENGEAGGEDGKDRDAESLGDVDRALDAWCKEYGVEDEEEEGGGGRAGAEQEGNGDGGSEAEGRALEAGPCLAKFAAIPRTSEGVEHDGGGEDGERAPSLSPLVEYGRCHGDTTALRPLAVARR